jgi:hypothetical protein
VLRYSSLERLPGTSNIIASVRTSEDVYPRPIGHFCHAHPSRRGEGAAPQDEARLWRVNSKDVDILVGGKINAKTAPFSSIIFGELRNGLSCAPKTKTPAGWIVQTGGRLFE